MVDVVQLNSAAWDKKVDESVVYTQAASPSVIADSRSGNWSITVTSLRKPVPRNWFPTSLLGVKILCLASGGGQQGPILAGAHVHKVNAYVSCRELLEVEGELSFEG